MYALSAIDIALWDIAGKAANLPLYRLLGGSPCQDLPAYASLLRYSDPAAAARYTEQALTRGYRDIKLHQIDVPSVQAARDVAGPAIAITIDTNCPWTVDEAIAMAHQFQPEENQCSKVDRLFQPDGSARPGSCIGRPFLLREGVTLRHRCCPTDVGLTTRSNQLVNESTQTRWRVPHTSRVYGPTPGGSRSRMVRPRTP